MVVADISVNTYETITVTGFVTDLGDSGDFTLRNFVFSVDESTVYKDSSGNVIQAPVTLQNLHVRAVGLVYNGNQVTADELTIL